MLLVGDLNIAPHENDVWSHKQLLKIVSHTPIEVERLKMFQTSYNFIDSIREFHHIPISFIAGGAIDLKIGNSLTEVDDLIIYGQVQN